MTFLKPNPLQHQPERRVLKAAATPRHDDGADPVAELDQSLEQDVGPGDCG